jgi:GNAT superfamily N-acetyltransferase
VRGAAESSWRGQLQALASERDRREAELLDELARKVDAAAELDRRFEAGFDPGDAVTAEADKYEAPGGAFVLARRDGHPVGCGAVLTLGPGIGEIKRMWIDASCRGLGLGRRMLGELEQRSAALGHHTVRLDTNRVLSQAIAMYESSGYHRIERYSDNPYAHHWFEKRLD